jgi:hypothetical protein
MTGRLHCTAFPREQQQVLAGIWLTPAAPLDDEEQSRPTVALRRSRRAAGSYAVSSLSDSSSGNAVSAGGETALGDEERQRWQECSLGDNGEVRSASDDCLSIEGPLS